jgi:hypothetical protein
VPERSISPLLGFPKEIGFIRAYLYGIMCGNNDRMITSEQFLAGCQRHGIDSPCPTLIKKMSAFGNESEMEDNFKRLLNKFKNNNTEVQEL